MTSPKPGMKFDEGKPRLDLIPPLAEWELGRVLAFGAQKYGERNWSGVGKDRYLAAAKRHINKLLRGEMIDEESGLHHAAHATCSLMMYFDIAADEVEKATGGKR